MALQRYNLHPERLQTRHMLIHGESGTGKPCTRAAPLWQNLPTMRPLWLITKAVAAWGISGLGVWLAIDGLATGVVTARAHEYLRSASPFNYWSGIAVYAAMVVVFASNAWGLTARAVRGYIDRH